MKLTNLSEAPGETEAPLRAFRRFAAVRTGSQLIPGVGRTITMKHGLCAPYGESADSLPTDYSIHGSPFDVDDLLKRVRPRGRLTVWREGEDSEFGVATTSGVSVSVFDGTSSVKLFRAVERFLTREARFLGEAARVRGSRIRRGLTTTIFVRAESLPVGFELPETILQLAAARRVPWAVMCIPCRADGAIAVGGGAVQQGDEADEP